MQRQIRGLHKQLRAFVVSEDKMKDAFALLKQLGS
jgi:hypothetical protein